MKKLTGNRRILTAFKSHDYTAIHKIIKDQEFVRSPLNFALQRRQYDLYRYLIDTHSDKIQPNIDSNFILNIPDYETLKITQQAYNKTFNENLILYKLQTMAKIKQHTRDIAVVLFFIYNIVVGLSVLRRDSR